jgi:demethylmenaquinone methyltransferase / 2-methoxy-6-polyprenyl-1,4-benzoquinol methylase
VSETHFGFATVDDSAKASRVRGVFDSVAPKYDLMNDLMSLGLHRAWKAYTVAVANVRRGDRVLDLAGGTGDLARAFAGPVGETGVVVHTDINEAMLRQGRDRLLDEGLVLPTVLCDAETLPFASGSFDLVSVAFGLRNMTHKDKALAEMARVLKTGGRLLVLEFSKVAAPLEKAYDWYSFKVLPRIGQLVAGDGASYRYLAESIRVHPDQAMLKAMMKSAGFAHVDVHNLAAGVVALHVGIKC